MISQFWLYFLGTGIIMRMIVPPLHSRNKTPTCYVRNKTNRDIHHFHFGVLFAITALLLVLLNGLNKPLLFFGAMGLSLMADELFIIRDISSKYFTKKGVFLSVLGHILIGIVITLVLIWVY